jgi:hypothetical protein
MTGMIAALRTDLLPTLMTFITTVTTSFGPVLIDALSNILRLVTELTEGMGPIAIFVVLIGETAGLLATMIGFTGPFATMLFTVIAITSALKLMALVMRFAGAITGITTMIALFKAWRAGTLAATAAQLGFNVALWTSPITWFVIGIAAIAIGFYLLYTRVEWFRNAVDATWNWIKDHWPLLLAILTGPIGIAVGLIIMKWDAIKEGFGAAVDWIREKWNALIDWILEKLDWLPGPVKSFLGLGGNGPASTLELAAAGKVTARGGMDAAPTPKLRAPSVAGVPLAAPEAGESGYSPVIRTTAKVYLDKRQIAEAVAEVNDDKDARR